MADISLLLTLAEAAGEAHEPTALGLNAGGWWSVSVLVLFAIALFAKVPAIIGAALDKKIDGIRQLLDEAAKLRKEAEALKAEYDAKLANAAKDAAAMTAAANHEAERIVAKAGEDAAALIARREKMAEDKIAAAERAAVDELRARTAAAASEAALDLIRRNHGAAADRALVDTAIAGIA